MNKQMVSVDKRVIDCGAEAGASDAAIRYINELSS